MKTKKIAGTDLPAASFAYVGDESDTSTWKLPIYFPGDNAKTGNHIKDALGRFSQTRGIAESDRDYVRALLVGAAIAHGIAVERKASSEPTQTQPQAVAVKKSKDPAEVLSDQMEALADRRATEMLRQLGWE